MTQDVEALNHACPWCQKENASRPHHAEFTSMQYQSPFELVQVDFIGPLPESGGNVHIMVMIDRFSRYVVLEPASSTQAHEAARIFYNSWICQFGVPHQVISDGGSSFQAQFSGLLDRLKIAHHTSAPHHPQGHGSVERANLDVEHVLRALFHQRRRWDTFLKPTQFVLNSGYNRAIGTTPFEVLFGYTPRLPLHAALHQRLPRMASEPLVFSRSISARLSALRDDVRAIQAHVHQQQLAEYRRHATGKVDFNPGDLVIVFYPRANKLRLQWRGPFIVVAREGATNIYHIRALGEGGREQRVAADRLKSFDPGSLTPDELLAESLKQGDFLAEDLLQHRVFQNKHYFLIKWIGIPAPDPDDPEAWMELRECRDCPVVRKFCKDNHIPLAHYRPASHNV